jgi:hypothetical protein
MTGPSTDVWVALAQVDIFRDWTAVQTVTIATAVIAVLGVAATILTTSARARREHLIGLYADALSAVANYLEGPYRIRRKDGTTAHRNTISAGISDVKASIDHSQTLLRLHARRGVADAYDNFVAAARVDAGQQMHEAWKLPAITEDEDVNLHVAYDRTLSDKYRTHVVKVMQADLARRWWNPWRLVKYAWHTHKRLGVPDRPTSIVPGQEVTPRSADTPTDVDDTPTRK